MRIPATICCIAAAATLAAQPNPAPRTDYAARLEPRGVIQHGAGQDPGAFTRYSDVMPAGGRPAVYMAYLSLKDLRADWADDFRRRLPFDTGTFLTLQIGLSMTSDGRPQDSYEARVADGEFDAQIQHLVDGLAALTLPVYLRIGYEFNGLSWNGYRPGPYRAAFRRIADALRARPELPVATVWCAAADGTPNFEEFYPGDDAVDWYGIDIFAARHFNDPTVAAFTASAEARRKPLMLGETTPRGEGAQTPGAWDAWFEPFFRWMAATPQLKQFNYINWDWAERGRALNPNWVTWGDARLETDSAEPVRERYIAALASPAFAHAATEADFWRSLDHPAGSGSGSEPEPPAAPRDLSQWTEATGGLGLAWTPLEEAQVPTLARYSIYRHGELAGFSLSPRFIDESARAGVPAAYRVAMMSRAGVLSELSEPLEITPETIVRCADDFAGGLGLWRLDSFHAEARGTVAAEEDAVRLTANQTSSANWHLQFRRFVTLHAGHRYRVTVRARAGRAATLPLWLQQDGGANTIYHSRSLPLTPEWRSFEWELPVPATTRASLALILGALPVDLPVWIGSVHCVELPQ